MSQQIDPRLLSALEDLDGYLADRVAPLLVIDAFETLVEFAPSVLAGALHDWSATQFRVRNATDSMADLYFHALKKIQMLEEFNLVPGERFARYVSDVATQLIEDCPVEERERLTGMLRYLREGHASTAPTVERLHRAPGGASPALGASRVEGPAVPLTVEESRNLRRFSLLLERLAPAVEGSERRAAPGEMAEQLMVTAATGARDANELEARMMRLHQLGVAPAVARDLVKQMAKAIPDWVVRREGAVEVVKSEPVEAVRRVIKLAGDGARVAERWKDLLRAAVEEFNQGAFARALTLIELAEAMVRDGSITPQVADISRSTAHESFDSARVLQALADPKNRPIVRRMLGFYSGWAVRELLDQLTFQPDQKKRRLLLALLELWGTEARPAVLERLGVAIAQVSSDANAWWFQRNLVYLLHRLPRTPDSDPRAELRLIAPFSALGNNPSFQRETFFLLGQLPGGHGGSTLMQRLSEIERVLEGVAPLPHELPEIWKILNSLATALVRTGSESARLALVEHALAQRPKAGESATRLRELAGTDLSGDRALVRRLLEALKTLLPVKVFGFVVSRNEETLVHVVRAFAATRDPEVRRAVATIAEKFPDREFGRIAAEGLVVPVATELVIEPPSPDALDFEAPAEAPPAAARASLVGDLEVFGLPGLLQSLQQSEVSGRMTLRDASGRERARIDLVEGRVAGCRCGRLSGAFAFYQIFEEPIPGTFELVRGTPPDVGSERQELLGLLMEAMRRFDELRRVRALIPDRANLQQGDKKPSAPTEEADGELVRRIWSKVRSGATAAECELEVEVDTYRVRTLLAHWVDEGALRVEATA